MQNRKLHCGTELEVLGVDIKFSPRGVHMMPSRDKRFKWVARMREVLQSGTLHPGEASKLSGRTREMQRRPCKRIAAHQEH